MNIKTNKTKKFARNMSAIALAVVAANSWAGDDAKSKSVVQEAKAEVKQTSAAVAESSKNAWVHGKLETTLLLNRHLNNFKIDSRVVDRTAYLSGAVSSDIDKDLAEEIALSIDGIDQVENGLVVVKDSDKTAHTDKASDKDRSWVQRMEDLTTSATIKSKLLANSNTSGMDIDVDTRNGVVTLKGEVTSAEESSLAEYVAQNTDGVASVVNRLGVNQKS
ncbi:MAG: BON domain-containing protein [Pseudomonadales bacterium]